MTQSRPLVLSWTQNDDDSWEASEHHTGVQSERCVSLRDALERTMLEVLRVIEYRECDADELELMEMDGELHDGEEWW